VKPRRSRSVVLRFSCQRALPSRVPRPPGAVPHSQRLPPAIPVLFHSGERPGAAPLRPVPHPARGATSCQHPIPHASSSAMTAPSGIHPRTSYRAAGNRATIRHHSMHIMENFISLRGIFLGKAGNAPFPASLVPFPPLNIALLRVNPSLKTVQDPCCRPLTTLATAITICTFYGPPARTVTPGRQGSAGAIRRRARLPGFSPGGRLVFFDN